MEPVLACVCGIAEKSLRVFYSLFNDLINRGLSGRAVFKYIVYSRYNTTRSGEIGKNSLETLHATQSLCSTERKNTHSSWTTSDRLYPVWFFRTSLSYSKENTIWWARMKHQSYFTALRYHNSPLLRFLLLSLERSWRTCLSFDRQTLMTGNEACLGKLVLPKKRSVISVTF